MVAWLKEWKAVRAEWNAIQETFDGDWDDHPRMVALTDRENELDHLIGENIATSVAGIVALATIALEFHGHGMREDCDVFAECEARLDQKILRNLLASAERLA